MQLALRGLGIPAPEMVVNIAAASSPTFQQCYDNSTCRAVTNLTCYGPGWFTQGCSDWRGFQPGQPSANLPMPVAIQAPQIDTTPGSPTYGQAMVNGQVVSTPEQAQQLIDQQIAEQAAANAAAVQVAMGTQAQGQCAVQAAQCGAFTSVSPDCTDCTFDPTKPLFLILVFGLLAVLMAKPWK